MEKKDGSSGQGKVLFLGNRSDVDRLYQAMDVFVLPSRYEGLPVVGVEAQAAGLPCVLSDKMTRETGIAENCQFENIDEGPCSFARNILEHRGEKRGMCNDIKQFDIFCQAKKLSDFYSYLLNTSFREGKSL